MTYPHTLYCVTTCLLLCAATPAQAADGPRAPANPADPQVTVPETRYRAVLPWRALPQPATSADQNWKTLNRTVGAIDSMSLTMGGADPEPAQVAAEDHAAHRHESSPKPAAQAAAAHPGQGHHHHEGMKQ